MMPELKKKKKKSPKHPLKNGASEQFPITYLAEHIHQWLVTWVGQGTKRSIANVHHKLHFVM